MKQLYLAEPLSTETIDLNNLCCGAIPERLRVFPKHTLFNPLNKTHVSAIYRTETKVIVETQDIHSFRRVLTNEISIFLIYY